MDKIKVNIQVVSMRKFVKQAKTHVINKCTKQIKFLENRKVATDLENQELSVNSKLLEISGNFLQQIRGNDEQVAKAKRKLQRLLEEVKILKKIKPDSVSKLALSKAKDWKAILAEKNVALEERCFAMLANHPPVQKSVEKFYSDNTELISKIPELVKEWEEKKSRRSELKKKKEKGNQDNAKNPNKLPIGNKNNFDKSNKTEVKNPNSASLKNQADSSDLKNIQNDISELNLDIKKTNKRKNSSDIMSDNLNSASILCSPPKRKLLVTVDAKYNESDGSLSDNSDHQDSLSENEMSVKNQTRNSYENESDDSLSDSSDIRIRESNHQNNPSKGKSLVGGKTKSDQSYENDSDDSLSNTSDITSHQNNQSEEKLQVKNNTKNGQTFKSGKVKETVTESNYEENSGKLPDIRSKLLEISKSKIKMQNKPINKPSVVQQLNAGVESDIDDEGEAGACKKLDSRAHFDSAKAKPSKPEAKSKIKAVTMLDLNELQDVDEIPIKKSDSEDEDETDEESGKQKKDPFFLCDGEIVSESDEDESTEKETERKRHFPSFKKNPYGNLNRRERRQSSFQNRQFNQHSANGKNSTNFIKKDYMKNKEASFKENKRGFKRAFDGHSEHRQNKKFQFASKDKFSNRNGATNFTKNPKENSFSPNYNRDVKKNNYPPKNNPGNFTPKVKPDDKPLHPSWEAKRKLKEAANVKFQGKRMVFKD